MIEELQAEWSKVASHMDFRNWLAAQVIELRADVEQLKAEREKSEDDHAKEMSREIRANMRSQPEFGYYNDER